MTYPIESIPDQASDQKDLVVYRRFRQNHFKKERILPSAFNFNPDGCSINWGRYSDEFMTLTQVGDNSHLFGVCSLNVRKIRARDLDIIHDPLPNDSNPRIDNRAHSLIISHSISDADIMDHRIYLSENCEIAIKPSGFVKRDS
jgi:hypothetical protein